MIPGAEVIVLPTDLQRLGTQMNLRSRQVLIFF
jgi:hypothetical protein